MKSIPGKKSRRTPGAAAKGRGRVKRQLRSKKSKTAAALWLLAQERSCFAAVSIAFHGNPASRRRVHHNLFTFDPSLCSLFHTTIVLQERKFMDSLEYTVASLENPQALIPTLAAMGRRHVTYGTTLGHYATVVKALLQTLGECLEKEFTPAVEAAWRLALEFVAETMQRGAAHVPH